MIFVVVLLFDRLLPWLVHIYHKYGENVHMREELPVTEQKYWTKNEM